MLGSASGLAGNWGSGFIFVHFSETFFSLSDNPIRWIALLALATFFMPRFSALHAWDTVVFFHSNPLRIASFRA
jgi:hypothetical protein